MQIPVFQRTILVIFLLWATLGSAGDPPVQEGRQLRTVVIDPGHGGHDPGAVVGDVKEKDLVLSVALRLGNKIKNSYPGVKVIYTRSKDVFIPLYERPAMAIKNKADVFISIHANYVAATGVKGTETFTLGLHKSQENLEVAKKENSVILLEEDYSANYQGFDPKETESYIMFENLQSEYQSQSIELASGIQEAFTRNIGLVNRGVKQAGFIVLKQNSMPSVLVEIGFISNPTEKKFLTSEAGREKISESIFQAFSAYKKTIDQRSRFDLADAGVPTSMQTGQDMQDSVGKEENALPSDTLLEKSDISAGPEKTQQEVESGNKGQTTNTVSAKKENTSSGTQQEKSPSGKSRTEAGTKTQSQPSATEKEVFYSVQVGAGKSMLEPVPSNFKGEKDVFRVKVEPYFKYYSGRFVTPEDASAEKTRLNTKFPGAFVVIFENGTPRMFLKQ